LLQKKKGDHKAFEILHASKTGAYYKAWIMLDDF
jgi:hypothetical protein